jgi:hypothetical protein|tara:strand:- start:377 stop:595 length:219 start_codon:yes stop_codon:yes gene_type:complete
MWPKEMGRTVNYDFTIDSLVSVEAPVGTDPDMLIDMALSKLIERAKMREIVVVFDTCFDGDTGVYSDDWEAI